MKIFTSPQVQTLIFALSFVVASAQNLKVVTPPDLVISSNLVFNLTQIKDPNDATFGRFVFDLTLRKKVVTHDLVCNNYCRKNPYTNYAGNILSNIVPKPSSKLACDFYNSYFDTAHKDNKYELVWGFDGYATGDSVILKEIVVNDYRHCTEGLLQRIFIVQDSKNFIATDTQDIWMVDCNYQYPISLSCHSDVILSLDSVTCEITVEPKKFLLGSGICNSIYKVEAKSWIATNGPLIDRNPVIPGVQLGREDINKEFQITIIDPVTGNKCWTRAIVEYKVKPTIKCPADISVSCIDGFLPSITGMPLIGTSCSNNNISYKDDITKGSCVLGYAWSIIRSWKVIDEQKNFAECNQHITVLLGSVDKINLPQDFNEQFSAPSCSMVRDTNLSLLPYIENEPSCVNGYLLDSVFWLANSNEQDIFPNRRRPRILGWNYKIDAMSPAGITPSPDHEYYDSYDLISNGKPGCWRDNEFIQWLGTGRPKAPACFNISTTYFDTYLSSALSECNGLRSNCFKILRKWTLLDWCTSELIEHIQIIKITDNEAPTFTYPTVFNLVADNTNTVDWNVPAPIGIDKCSESILHSIESPVGNVVGNSSIGYFVRNIPIGDYIVKVKVFDCCGNQSEKEVLVKVRAPNSTFNPNHNKISIFPNPTKGQISILADVPYDQIIIHSLDGKVISNLNRNTSSNYDLSGFSSGIYFIKVIKEGHVIYVEKLIISTY